ncbi:hypothetical protein, partial [Mycoplasma marinum]
KWSINSAHKESGVGMPALDVLKNKKTVTFHYSRKIEPYDVVQANLIVDCINMAINTDKKILRRKYKRWNFVTV